MRRLLVQGAGLQARRPMCPPSKEFSEQSAQPAGDTNERAGADRRARRLSYRIAIPVEDQADAGRERRAVHVIGEAADAAGAAAADRQVENLLGDFRHAVEDGTAAGQHDAGVEALLVAGPADFVPHQVEDLLGARLQDLGQDAARHHARLPAAHARNLHRLVFVELWLPATMWTFTSRRAPVIPTGAPIPSCSSTTKSCGSTCRISRPVGSETALAASMARRTSSRVISRFFPATAITPRLLKPLMCGPERARWTESISTPAINSASSTAFLIDSTAASTLTTRPRRMPRDSATPRPTTSRRSPSTTSPTTAVTFEVPTSSPTR